MNETLNCQSRRQMEDLSHRAALALDAGKMGTFEWDVVARMVMPDATLSHLFGLPLGPICEKDILKSVHPNDLRDLRAAIERSSIYDKAYDTAFRILREGQVVWVGGRGRVVERDATGAPLRMLGVNWDMSEVKQNETHQRNLVLEMNHRINNSFALMEALIAFGQDAFETRDAFSQALSNQIHALSDAHILASDHMLHQSTNMQVLGVKQVFARALRQVPKENLMMQVPDVMAIHCRDAAALSMIAHQMATRLPNEGLTGKIHLTAKGLRDGWAVVKWCDGAGTTEGSAKPRTPDFILDICLEKLGGRLHQYTADENGCVFEFEIPVLRRAAP